MRGAVPTTKPARAQIDAIAVGTPPAAFGAEVQEQTVRLFFHTAAPSNTRFVKTGLAFCRWCDTFEPARVRDQQGFAFFLGVAPSLGRGFSRAVHLFKTFKLFKPTRNSPSHFTA